MIRRRRADKFDKDAALAAEEAAATAHNGPGFEDGYGYGSARHGAGGYGYAETFQPPVSFPPTRETYGPVSNIPYADPDNFSVGTGGGPGAAGIGAGTLYRSKSGKDLPDPFHAYPPHQDPIVSQQQTSLRYRNPGQDRWGDPNLLGGGYDPARNQPHPDSAGVARSKSIQSSNPAQSLASHYSTDPLTQDPSPQPPPVPESYLDHYRAGFDPEKHQPQTRPLSTASMTDVYGGVAVGKQPPPVEKFGEDLSNPFESQTSGDRYSGSSNYSEINPPVVAHDDPRMSLRDDEDYGAGRRVLKVCLLDVSLRFPNSASPFFPFRLQMNDLSPQGRPRPCRPVSPLSFPNCASYSPSLLFPRTLPRLPLPASSVFGSALPAGHRVVHPNLLPLLSDCSMLTFGLLLLPVYSSLLFLRIDPNTFYCDRQPLYASYTPGSRYPIALLSPFLLTEYIFILHLTSSLSFPSVFCNTLLVLL